MISLPIIVDYRRDGDVFLAISEEVATRSVEAIDVLDGEVYFFDANGYVLTAQLDGKRRIERFVATDENAAETVETRLRQCLYRLDRAHGVEKVRDYSMTPLRGLIELLGGTEMAFKR